MVARIVSGKSIRGVLNYNENKVKNMEARLLMAAGYPRGPQELSFNNKLLWLERLTRQNEKTRTNALHITLNFSNKDIVDDLLLQRIAIDYMDQIGFGNQPYLVYRHFDAAHPHIHIATVNIAEGGLRIETHNLGRNQSEKARKNIEENYGLVRAEDQKPDQSYMLRPTKLASAAYGKAETKATISAIVREVTGTYKFTSLPELNAALRQFNVAASRGPKDSRMYEKGGLVYHMIGEDGDAIGIPIKASSIYSSPTLKNLELKFTGNKTERKPYALRLKHLLDRELSRAKSKEELERQLRQQGIRILLRENVQGNIYGVTFIDNATRSVFNGSDLGKAYSAMAFAERLERLGAVQPERQDRTGAGPTVKKENKQLHQEENVKAYPANDRQVIEVLWDLAFSDRYEENSPNPFKRKRRNLGLE